MSSDMMGWVDAKWLQFQKECQDFVRSCEAGEIPNPRQAAAELLKRNGEKTLAQLAEEETVRQRKRRLREEKEFERLRQKLGH